MKADIVVCHPRDILYPYWMARMRKDRDLFGRIIVIMTQKATDRDYTRYLRGNLKEATIIEKYKDDGRDWRNAAINFALRYVVSPFVLFLEQDFLVADGFFERLLESVDNLNASGFLEGNRFHPACLLIRKDVIDKYTSKDFSAKPPEGDHFVRFSKEVKELGNWGSLWGMGLPNFFHLAGLTQNFRLASNFYQPRQFFTYLVCCGAIDQPEDWIEFTFKKIKEVGEYPLDGKIKEFFNGL